MAFEYTTKYTEHLLSFNRNKLRKLISKYNILHLKNYTSVDVNCPSPNFDDRPEGEIINAIVIHAISLPPDCFGGEFVEQLFTNCLKETEHPYFRTIKDLKVSAHFYIKRSGVVIQFVDPFKRAWHAGESMLNNKPKVNDFSIGIELEGCDTHPFENSQYEALTRLSHDILTEHPAIHLDQIVGHSDISPGRKTDPGPLFDWQRYRSTLNERQAGNKKAPK